jgi:hypothetical protein
VRRNVSVIGRLHFDAAVDHQIAQMLLRSEESDVAYATPPSRRADRPAAVPISSAPPRTPPGRPCAIASARIERQPPR